MRSIRSRQQGEHFDMSTQNVRDEQEEHHGKGESSDDRFLKTYELIGVINHKGVAGGGHYYCISRESGSDEWYKFNDDRVSAFDIEKHLDSECFGGKEHRTIFERNSSRSRTREVDKGYNAFMLVY